jgi:hypothetical protein
MVWTIIIILLVLYISYNILSCNEYFTLKNKCYTRDTNCALSCGIDDLPLKELDNPFMYQKKSNKNKKCSDFLLCYNKCQKISPIC